MELDKPLEVKFITRTASGTLIKVPGELMATKTRIEFLKSPFSLKDAIKSMKGSRWHGFEDPPRKIWSVENCPRNWFQLQYMLGLNPYEFFERDVVKHEYERPLMEHQKELTDRALAYHFQIFASEMGCISGDAIVHCNRAGKGFSLSLRELCYKFHGGNTSGKFWDNTIDTHTQGYIGKRIGLNIVKNVLFQGVKKVVQLTTTQKTLILTPDHEVCVDARWYGTFKRVDELKVNDIIMVALPKYTPSSKPVEQLGFEKVVSIEDAGETDVYDIVCEGPYHNFVADEIVVHNCGKTLSAIELMERSGVKDWMWIGPRSGLYAVEREFKKWGIADDIEMEVMTYEGLTARMKTWTTGDKPPQGVIFDESSKVKNTKAQRTQAAQALADGIREEYGMEGYVVLMSGTPAPRSPVDWHSQCEIAYPGFIREGNETAFKMRLGIYEKQENTITGQTFLNHVAWKDDETKCDVCGGYDPMSPPPGEDIKLCSGEGHRFTKSKNEVAYLFERMKGLTVVQHKKDCLDLPDKRYRIIECDPPANLLRVAEAIVSSAPTTIQALILLRELSDGFQYRNTVTGQKECPTCKGTKVHEYYVDPEDSERIFEMVDFMDPEYVKTLKKQLLSCLECEGTGEVDVVDRTVKTVPCPKDEVLKGLLAENEEHGRVIVFAGFQASIDKLTALCNGEGWKVLQVDGRGWNVYDENGQQLDRVPLDYWADLDISKVAFVANPRSGGMGLTLTEACMSIYYSNDYSSESRTQSEDRIHRPGTDMNKGATIVDLINLPSDQAVLDRLRSNRRLEKMTLGELEGCYKCKE